jgi:hypothetical protein
MLHNLITNIAFDNPLENTIQKNDILPLFILYSSDSLIEIGDPKVMGNSEMNTLWEDTFYSIFKNKKEREEEIDIEKILSNEYNETRIDEELTNFERRVSNQINESNIKKKKTKA